MHTPAHPPASPFARPLMAACPAAVLVALSSGGGNGSGASSTAGDALANTGPRGSEPSFRNGQVSTARVNDLTAVRYTIASKPGAASKPVSVSYGIDALARRGNVDTTAGRVNLPVFGLYAGHANQVSIEMAFADGSTQALAVEVDTEPFVDPTGIYANPTVLKARAPGSALGFDYLVLKNMRGGPIVIDTDGAVRWVAPAGVVDSTSTVF